MSGKRRTLVTDLQEDAQSRALLTGLHEDGFEISHAASAAQALEQARTAAADLVLLGVDGALDPGVELRAGSRAPCALPIALLVRRTGFEVANAYARGATDVFLPPWDVAAVRACLLVRAESAERVRELGKLAAGLGRDLDSLPELVIELNSDGLVHAVRGRGRDWLEAQPTEELAHTPCPIETLLPEHPAQVLRDAAGQAGEQGRSSLVTFRWDANGTERWFEAMVGQHAELPARFMAVLRDTTERRRAEKERALIERALRHDDKMKGLARLSSGVANDLNNVLGAVMGFASSLRADVAPSSPSSQDVDRIIEACWKGYDLAKDLSSIAAEGSAPTQRVLMNDLIRNVAEIMERAIPPGIAMRTELSRSEAAVRGDPVALNQMLVNLALNALDAMKGSGILTFATTAQTLRAEDLRDTTQLKPGRYVVLEVVDTGAGMSASTLERAFEPFFTTKPTGKAPGLGLPMVYGIVANHEGFVTLTSEPGQGTTAMVYLPVYVPAQETTNKESAARPAEQASARVALVVDDEELLLALGRRLLERMGFEVLTTQSGAEAAKLYAERQHDICFVLLDLIMPVIDGAETFRLLRELDPGARVVLTSGHSRTRTVQALLAQGALAFLHKPFDLDRLRNVLTQAGIRPPEQR